MSLLGRIKSELAYVRGTVRALRRTTSIARTPTQTIRDLAEDLAYRYKDRPALISARETLTYRQWNGRANQYARWARQAGIGKGDVVGLLMPNRPEYMAIWLGIAKAGGVTALINTNLPGPSLAHCVKVANARALIVDAALLPLFETARDFLPDDLRLFVHGENPHGDMPDMPRIDLQIRGFSDADIPPRERVRLTINDRCLYIYTSGTTGLPKPANLNHYRVLLAIRGFWGTTGATAQDRMYDPLPMYHTVGGLTATGAVLCAGGSCFIREKFSAGDFWREIVEQNCTMFAYVGELCRYLVAQPPGPWDRAHRIRLCFGNGLRPDVWPAFRDRFQPGVILEFYAATEGNVTLFNFDSREGAIGRLPKWMERRFVIKLVKFDVESEQPVRDANGFCIECAPGETGEALGQIINDPAKPAARFEGYADATATEKKILHDVFETGDAWFRSGDLLRKDAQGYFYFVDRIGDTFRWKGENVSTSEVAETISGYPGVQQATVYGVAVPGRDGRAGMAAIVVDDPATFDLAGFRAFLDARLPDYARPVFLRFREGLDMTGTFKARKVDLVADGFDPAMMDDPLHVYVAPTGYQPVDQRRFDDILAGTLRL